MKKVLWSAFLCLFFVNGYGEDVSITDFGAKSGLDDNTAAIQKAMDQCASNGGGTVHVPVGTYVVRTVFLRNGTNLHIHAGATIKGIPDPDIYQEKAIVVGNNIRNASISGEGSIDGQGSHANFQFGDNKGNRPHIIQLNNCSGMTVTDVSLVNSASWTLRLLCCDGVQVRDIRIWSHGNHNCDGIDINSKNVIISGCRIDCDDDAICFKSEKIGYDVEHVTVSNCIIASNCNGIKFGTGSYGGFRNIAINNCIIRKASENNIRKWKKQIRGISADTTVISGIALEVVDGGFMDQVVINNISMQDVQTPIFIRLGNRNGHGILKNIIISNITARCESLITSSITGIPGHYAENIALRDIIFSCTGGASVEDASIIVPEKEKEYPENRMFGHVLPAYGLYVRHVKNLTIENIQCFTRNPDARPAFTFDDVHNLWLNNFQASVPSGNSPILQLAGSSDVIISGFRTQQNIPLFLKIDGLANKNVNIKSNDFSKVQKKLLFDKQFNQKQVIH